MAAPKPISEVLRGLEARYEWGTDLSAIIQVAGLAHISAIGQASKLGQAIIALEKAEAEIESSNIDFDQPQDSVVLSKLGDSYYERYKFLLPAVVDPCDTLVSRLAREMETRHLALTNVWGTRTQEFQREQSAKREKLSPSGDTFVEVVHNQPKEEVVEKTIATYVFKDLTLMVAYAEAGSMSTTPPSGSLPREVRGSDTLSV